MAKKCVCKCNKGKKRKLSPQMKKRANCMSKELKGKMSGLTKSERIKRFKQASNKCKV